MTGGGEPRHAHKEVRQMAAWLRQIGFRFSHLDGNTHAIYEWPATGETLSLPGSPGSHVWVDNTRKAAARIAGIDISTKRNATSIKEREARAREKRKEGRAREAERKKQAALRALRQRNQEAERLAAQREIQRRRQALSDIERLMRQKPTG